MDVLQSMIAGASGQIEGAVATFVVMIAFLVLYVSSRS